MIKDLKEITFPQSMLVVLLFTGAVAPGLLLMCLYKPELIMQLDAVKLVMLALSATLPMVIWDFLIFQYLVDYDLGKRTKAEFAGMMLAFNLLIFYQLIVAAYWYSWSFKYFLGMLLGTQVAISFWIWLDRKWSRMRSKRASVKQNEVLE